MIAIYTVDAFTRELFKGNPAGVCTSFQDVSSSTNLDKFFQQWVYGEGYPSYVVSWSQNKNNWMKVKLSQTSSHASVSFYEMPVPIQFKSTSKDTTIIFDHSINGQEFWVNIGFVPDTVVFDPQVWLLSAKNSITKIHIIDKNITDIYIYD